ncbi:MAG: ubiquinol-cytochrome c reductase iron-sulfur subunit [Betaproteobacteria bacterium]|nr:ubiquinol-cytochrome c reductase iron-sulfur subunit [Betaproteobacteria bacterium]MDH4325025.1 ubiquinol-cytochrome c reductase iron-sulfur subunit [Betaproteobacteria bacterium]MDH5579769.1 ubiquinol-cytochrome c reductase iron-sulfur subunit [Betaproteobacteria bacterium]
MNDDQKVDKTRRNLVVATSVVGGAASVGAAIPFIASMMPSERAKAGGAPVEVDISGIAPGELKVVEWRGKPVWVIRRTTSMLESLKTAVAKLTDPASKSSLQPEYAANEYRSLKPDVMVMEGVCTHLGCSPQMKTADAKAEMGGDWAGGFYCACHGSKFDMAGRVFRGAPAPTNLTVPPYTFLSDSTLLIGEDKKGA